MKRIILAVLVAALVMLAGADHAAAQATGITDQEIQRFTVPGSNTTGSRVHADASRVHLTLPVGAVKFTGAAFADLSNYDLGPGTLIYCTDCTKASPCAGSSTGAWAKRRAGQWDCD